ncbi:MAG: hypothetical protein J2P26_14795, partial [Nocardiopsaceae bacterium]|nr:hypothetical protein [Nocardiopsaceae bacterium]
GEQPVIRIGQGPAPADGHQTRVALLREDHGRYSPPFTRSPVHPMAGKAVTEPGGGMKITQEVRDYAGGLSAAAPSRDDGGS